MGRKSMKNRQRIKVTWVKRQNEKNTKEEAKEEAELLYKVKLHS